MNFKTTVRLLVALAVVAGGLYLLDRGGAQDVVAEAGLLFPDLDVRNLEAIVLMDRVGKTRSGRIELSRGPDGASWSLSAEVLSGGRTLRASQDVVTTMLTALRDAAALRVHRPEPTLAELEADGLGADARSELLFATSDGIRGVLWLGTVVDGAGGLAVRRGEKGPVFVVDRTLADLLVPDAISLEDAALVALGPYQITGISVLDAAGGAALALVRDVDRWLVTEPMQALADAQRAEELRNALAGLRILARTEREASSMEVVRRVRLASAFGDPLEIALGAPEGGGRLPATVSDRDGVVLIGQAILPLLEREPGAYRDRRVNPILPARITRVSWKHEDVDVIMRRVGDRFDLTGSGWTRPRTADPVAAADLLDRVTRMSFTSFDPDLVISPEDSATFEVEHGTRGSTETVTDRFLVGEVNADGLVPVARAGARGGGLVPRESLLFLEREPHEAILRILSPTDAYFRLARMTIADRREGRVRSVDLEGRIAGRRSDLTARLVARTLPGGGGRSVPVDVPEEVLRPVQYRMIHELQIERWRPGSATSDRDEGEALLTVSWLDATNASTSGIPADPEGPTYRFLVWPAGPDGIALGRLETDTTLSFEVQTGNLLPFFELLRWAEG